MYKNVLWTIGIAVLLGVVGVSEHSDTRVEGVQSTEATYANDILNVPSTDTSGDSPSLTLRPTETPMPTVIPTITPTIFPTGESTPTIEQMEQNITGENVHSAGHSGEIQ